MPSFCGKKCHLAVIVIQIGVLVNLVTRAGIIKKICWRIALKHESEWKKTACILCCIVAV